MSKFLTDEQRLFKEHVVLIRLPVYTEYGDTFTRFRDPESGKLFEVRIKEVKPKINKVRPNN